MKNIAIIVKPHTKDIKTLTENLVEILKKHNKSILLEERTAKVLNLNRYNSEEEIRQYADLLIVLGGDGTLISAVRILEDKDTPVMGINLGRLGFLTDTKIIDFERKLKEIFRGNYKIEKRMKLHVDVLKNGENTFSTQVMNDVVINKGALARIIDIDVFVDELFMNRYRADGIIVATPTGSTAYTLAAGGPIVFPTLNSIIVTPICPHSLSHRPIVLNENSSIKLEISDLEDKVFLTCDGQTGKKLEQGEKVIVRKSGSSANLIVTESYNYFSLLKEKLGWGATNA